MNMQRRRCSGAFTLIELLVVIAIVAVLGGLLLPTLSRAAGKVSSAQCQGNLKQWVLGLQLYGADNNDWLPPEGSPNPSANPGVGWYVQLPDVLRLQPYAQSNWRTNLTARLPRSSWLCPANPRTSDGKNLFHYTLNQWVDGTGDYDRATRLSEVHSPELTVYLFDNGKKAAVSQHNNLHTNAHQRGANISFVDGHVQWFSSHTYLDKATHRVRTNAPGMIWRAIR
jgi:prepilin-type processing-associated H-X9-DG protein/prepilin-type N-terminal cleavage/methylation domain-containing protein